MSVIAWDGKTIAADRQVTSGTLIYAATKLRRIPATGEVIGYLGHSDHGHALMKWYENGASPSSFPECQKKDEWAELVVVNYSGVVSIYQQQPYPLQVEDDFRAWGSGAGLAMGAMACGVDAEKAVRIACKYDSTCGCGVDVYDLLESKDRLKLPLEGGEEWQDS